MANPKVERTIVKNASANLLRLVGSGVVALLLPPFLVRMLPKEVYGTWSLLLQLTLYVTYLDFGVQTAVAKFVAHANELGDADGRDEVVSTATLMLSVAAVIGTVLIVFLSWQLPQFFPGMPAFLQRPSQLT